MTTAESEIYFYAFRYCLGRMTCAVSDFIHDDQFREVTKMVEGEQC